MRHLLACLLFAVVQMALVWNSPAALAQDQVTDTANQQSAMSADHHTMTGDEMRFDATGLVMNANATELPRDCTALAGDYEFTVNVGRDYASAYAGAVFGMSQHEYRVPPCSRVTVTLINEDQIRHQWMLHGLPRYLYPQGMFHLEAAGGQTQTGTFIVPSDDQTYLVHCDMTQHMEKGMKGQLVAGSGSGDLWSIPGVSQEFRQQQRVTLLGASLVITMAIMSFLVFVFLGKRQ